MPSRRLVVAFFALWVTLGVALFVASVRTLLAALSGTVHGPAHAHLALLAGAEALAALLFLLPRTTRIGAIGLLVTIGIAFLAHAVDGQFPMLLLLYASAVGFVLVHGPVPWGVVFARGSEATAGDGA
jgi:hypothetical protein